MSNIAIKKEDFFSEGLKSPKKANTIDFVLVLVVLTELAFFSLFWASIHGVKKKLTVSIQCSDQSKSLSRVFLLHPNNGAHFAVNRVELTYFI